MPKSNPDRRRDRNQRAVEMFGHKAQAALDAFALLDFAWHDCYGQSAPPDRVIEDIWTVANGDLGRLISAAHLAVIDFRDLRLNAQDAKPSSETT